MTNNTNQGTNKPGQTPERDKRKTAPSVPAASRSQRTSPGQSKTAAAGPKTPAPRIRPAQSTSTLRPQSQLSARALTRHETDLKRQRQLVWVTAGVIGFILLVLAFGIWQTSLAPNFETLAEVNGQSVSRADYNKFRKIDLFKQSGSLQQQLNYTSGDQQTQLQSQLSLLQDEEVNVASRPVNQDALERLVGNIVMEKAAKDQFNISVSDDEVNKYLGDQFQGIIYTPTANPSEAIQTQTAGPVASQAAQFNTATAGAVTPLPTPTPSVSPTTEISGTVTAATTPGLTPEATTTAGAGTPGATTTVSGTVTVSGTATVEPSPTTTSTPMAADKVQQTAQAYQSDYLKSFRSFTTLTDDDYKKFEARPTLIKKKVVDKLQATEPKVGDPYPQIKLSHILVADEATAQQIYDELKATPADQLESKFVQLAREKSTDTGSASHNGDLGWNTDKTQFDKDFLAAALPLEKGQFTKPVKTQFGYHIIYCTDKDPKRPLDALTIQAFQQPDANGDPAFFSDWLKDKVKAAGPKYNTPPTPAPTATIVPVPAFTPVIPPTVTPVPPTPEPTTAAAATTAAGATTAAAGTTPAVAATTAGATTGPVTTAAPTPSPTK
jgi:parvulin-like peptidyl-prolyl isomerase